MTTAAAAPLWTAEQLRWLAALELKPWMQGALPEAASTAAAHDMQEDTRPARIAPAVREFQPRPQRAATAPRLDDAPVANERVASRRTATSVVPDKLHFALIRASGLNPNAPEAQAIIAAWPSSAELRANPQAKRALWPSLRKLRKAARTGAN